MFGGVFMKYQQIPGGKGHFFRVLSELAFRFFVLLGLFALVWCGWELAQALWQAVCRELPVWLLSF